MPGRRGGHPNMALSLEACRVIEGADLDDDHVGMFRIPRKQRRPAGRAKRAPYCCPRVRS